MFLLWVDSINIFNSVEKELPSPNLQIDPRPIYIRTHDEEEDRMTFEITYHDNGKKVTITRTDDNDEEDGWIYDELRFRVYDPAKEVVPSFKSTIYTYLGVDGEVAPREILVGIVSPSVQVIQREAFDGCKKMKFCLMNDNVEVIHQFAFNDCKSMKTIRLSKNLKRIGRQAFGFCESLDALFIPPSVSIIGALTCSECTNIRILSLPQSLDIQQIGHSVVSQCRTLFETTQIQGYDHRPIVQIGLGQSTRFLIYLILRGAFTNNDEVHQSLIDFNRNRPPLHKICLHTDISAQKVHDCIRTHGRRIAYNVDHNGMTPLHILCMNPYATTGSILACVHQNMSAVIVMDNSEMTPIDYLRKCGNGECLIALLQALCIHRESCLKFTTVSGQDRLIAPGSNKRKR